MRILIVDDNIDSVEFICQVLAPYGYELLRAYDGTSCLNIAKDNNLDLILLDVMMPDIDGFMVCKELMGNPMTSGTPIIMVTAKTAFKDLEMGLDSGAYDYIRKPFHTTELVARVKAALRFKKNHDELIVAKQKLEEMNEDLAHLAITDSLTKIYNHTFLVDTLMIEINKSERFDKSLAFFMIDIDHFKLINDTYGHLIGDEILKEVVRLIKRPIRAIDILGRYGGEEFGLILPETDEHGAMFLAEKLRGNIEDHTFLVGVNNASKIELNLTVSIGVAIYPSRGVSDVIELIKKADNALYVSKKQGRNKVYKIDD